MARNLKPGTWDLIMKKSHLLLPGCRGKSGVPKALKQRLPLYLRELELLRMMDVSTVTSRQLGARLGINEHILRKDLTHIGQTGAAGIGYNVKKLAKRLKTVLGRNKARNIVLVGCGNLGQALAHYKGFKKNRLHIVSVFDNSRRKVGRRFGRFTIRSMSDLSDVVKKKKATLGIIAVPAASAQGVANQLIEAGITGIFSFAPITLSIPERGSCVGIDLAILMEQSVCTCS